MADTDIPLKTKNDGFRKTTPHNFKTRETPFKKNSASHSTIPKKNVFLHALLRKESWPSG